MPKRKTGARKKAEKQKQRQKDIKNATSKHKALYDHPCNSSLVRALILDTCQK